MSYFPFLINVNDVCVFLTLNTKLNAKNLICNPCLLLDDYALKIFFFVIFLSFDGVGGIMTPISDVGLKMSIWLYCVFFSCVSFSQ